MADVQFTKNKRLLKEDDEDDGIEPVDISRMQR